MQIFRYLCFLFRTYEGIKVTDLSNYIIERLPPNYDDAAKQRYIA